MICISPKFTLVNPGFNFALLAFQLFAIIIKKNSLFTSRL